MDSIGLVGLLEVSAIAGMLSFVLIYVAGLLAERRRLPRAANPGDDDPGMVFLFDDERLVDATPRARQLLARPRAGGSAWERLVRAFSGQFPAFGAEMATLVDRGTVSLTSLDGMTRIDAEWRAGLARLEVVDVSRPAMSITVDRQIIDSLEAEVATLRDIAAHVPYLTWKEAPDGAILWANAAYLTLSARLAPDARSLLWPPHPVFAPHASPADTTGRTVRAAVTLPGEGGPCWYDVHTCPSGNDVLRVAFPVDAIVTAEESRTTFARTLTHTFGALSVGLAVFDRDRRLQIFNPALGELTTLRVEFLAQRPGLASFLDRLRNARILPEPRNFDDWRQRLASLECAAEEGTFAERWTLIDGRVFDVIGRPFPDGAIALLIRDISVEMRLTRLMRSEIELAQSVLDTLGQAIAVFDPGGTMILANAAYRAMWGIDTSLAARPRTLAGSLRQWRTECPSATGWTRIPAQPERAEFREFGFLAERLTGRPVDVGMTRLPGGALLASFLDEQASHRSLRPGPAADMNRSPARDGRPGLDAHPPLPTVAAGHAQGGPRSSRFSVTL